MMKTYCPMAKLKTDGKPSVLDTLFTYDSLLSVAEAMKTFKVWKEYNYKIEKAWIDVFDGGKEPIETIPVDMGAI